MPRRGYRPPPQRRRRGNYIDDFPLAMKPGFCAALPMPEKPPLGEESTRKWGDN